MAQAYLKSFPEERRSSIPVRFDIIVVYGSGSDRAPRVRALPRSLRLALKGVFPPPRFGV